MWRFEQFEQNDKGVSPVQKRARQFQSVLSATCKHFLSIQQPLSLFHYLFDKLIAESQRKATDQDCLLYPLEIDERINWLQKALDCLEHSCLSSRSVSEDLKIKKEQTKFSIRVLNLQKMVVSKLAKLDEEDVPRLRHFYTYSLAQQLVELLDITDRYEMLSVQLRALDFIEETQPAPNPEDISSRMRLFQVTW